MSFESTTGKILIATPAIGDGTFEQSVIFMLHHSAEAALGVIINRATSLPVQDLLPRWGDLTAAPGVVFSGGPVETNGFIGVGRAVGPQPGDVEPVPNTDLVTIDLDADPALTSAHIDRLRIFRGYAGWGPRQLDTELAAGAWFTVASDEDDMWSLDPDALYERILRRQSGELRWFANAPQDPSLN